MKRTKGLFKGYRITNKITKKQYIGITSKSVSHRWGVHKTDCKHTKSEYKNHLHNSMIKHGVENFEIKSIMKADSWEEICAWEIHAIKEYGTKSPGGYNLTDGGEGCFGVKRTETMKRKLSESKKEYYKNPKHRQEQGIRVKLRFEDPIYRKKQAIRSKKLWQDETYRETTTNGLKERWKNPELREKHKSALRQATTENPEWMERTAERNKDMATDPEWRKKVSEGLKRICNTDEFRKKRSKIGKSYWDEGHQDRRKKTAETMSKGQQARLKNPEYIKWRKENPPGGKPMLYRGKYFRTATEAMDYFKVGCNRITMDILKQVEGCRKLNVKKKSKYPYEIKY